MTVFLVTTTDDELDAVPSEGAGLSLREALVLANNMPGQDEVAFDPSLTGSTIYLTRLTQLEITSDVTIDADIDNDGTGDITVDANSAAAANNASSRVLAIASGITAIDGLTITGGSDLYGAGIRISAGASASLTNSTINGNYAFVYGGGIHNGGGTLTLENGTVADNSAGVSGGGIFGSNGSTTMLTNSTVSGNGAVFDGGGLGNIGGALMLTNTTVIGNNASRYGGGIYSTGTMTLANSTISGNSALVNGGGISGTGLASLTNSTISGNSASVYGGGIEIFSGTLTLINSTMSGNSAGVAGGGIYGEVDSTVALTNSIVLGNTAPSISESGGPAAFTNNLSIIGGFDPADVFAALDGKGGGLLANNGGPVQTIALLANGGNPALDAGDDDGPGVPATDARGLARFDQLGLSNNGTNISDLGAYELQVQVNIPPVAVDDSATIDEDSSATIPVLANDTDIDGDTLTAAFLSGPANGSVQLAGNFFIYTPVGNFNGIDSFTYSVSDGNGGSDIGTVTITVNPVNDPPVAADDNAAVDEDGSVTINVLANDSDIDGDALVVNVVSGPASGTANVVAGGISYVPDANFNGTDGFTYTVSDGNGGTDTASVTITINPVNDPPVAADDAVTAAIDETSNYAAATLLANDSDVDGDTLTVTAVGGGVNGSARLNGTTVTFTPDAGFTGAASFTYTVSDGNGGSDTGTVNVTVADNLPPLADTARAVTTLTGTVLVFDIAASDPDGDALSFSASTPANGAVSLVGGRVTYTPAAGFTGSETITFTIDDGNGGTATQDVTITTQNLPASNQFVMFTADGFAGGAGGSGAVNGSDGFQQIAVIDVPGAIALDPSFNKGGDILQLSGDASAWNITRSGSSALFSDGDTFVTVPVGTAGLAVLFDDGVRSLKFDGSNFAIGGQAFASGTLSPITAAPDGTSLPTGADPAAKAVLFIAADAGIAASGVVDIFGAAGNELARLISGNLTLDASFNKGGDTIAFDEAASDYLANQSGSSLRLTGSDTTALIPVGTSGATLAFGDGSDTRTLLLDTTIPAITIAGQQIGPDPVQLMAV